MKLVCMTTHSSTPNQTRSMFSLAATGARMGTRMKAISKKSRKNASTKMNVATNSRKPICPPGSAVSRCSTQCPPSMPWKTRVNTVEPIRMNITIAVMRIVDCAADHSRGSVIRRCIAARRTAPTAPMAPDSVGVARPTRMVPSTRKINADAGTIPQRTCRTIFQRGPLRASSGNGGIDFGRTTDSAAM